MIDRRIFHVDFSMFVDRPGVGRAIDRWVLSILKRTGAYGRGVMKKLIRPNPIGKRSNTVQFLPTPQEAPPHWPAGKWLRCWVPVNADGSWFGPVLDADTGRPVNRFAAYRARLEWAKLRRIRFAGQPPRRGPTDNLRRLMFFGLDDATESVVIGPLPFARQPQMVGAVSVPQLLNFGGYEYLRGPHGQKTLVKYEPRPYLEPTIGPTQRFMESLIVSKQVNDQGPAALVGYSTAA